MQQENNPRKKKQAAAASPNAKPKKRNKQSAATTAPEDAPTALPEEFWNGPWINAAEMMAWFNVTKECVKGWKGRGITGYSLYGGISMYNKPYACLQLAQNWIQKPRKKPKK